MKLKRAAWLLSCSGLVACQGALDLDQYTFESHDPPIDGSAGGPNGASGGGARPEGLLGAGTDDGSIPAGNDAVAPLVEHDSLTREPNDTPAAAAPFGLGEVVDYVALTLDDDVRDYYSTSVQRGVTYTLEIINDRSCSFRYSVGLGADGRRASLTEGSTIVSGSTQKTRIHEFLAPAEGPILLDFGGINAIGGSCPRYQFVLRQETAAGLLQDELTLEPNNSPSTAAPWDISSPAQGLTLAGGTVDPLDFYRIDAVSAGVSYVFEVSNPSSCRLSFELWSAAVLDASLSRGTTIDPNANVLPSVSREFTAPADDAVLLRFTPYSSLSEPCAGYGFSLVASGASPAPP